MKQEVDPNYHLKPYWWLAFYEGHEWLRKQDRIFKQVMKETEDD